MSDAYGDCVYAAPYADTRGIDDGPHADRHAMSEAHRALPYAHAARADHRDADGNADALQAYTTTLSYADGYQNAPYGNTDTHAHLHVNAFAYAGYASAADGYAGAHS